MNKLIKELALQADSYAKAEYEKWTPTDDFSGVPHIRNIYNERFAELIVREMLDITDAHTKVFQTDRDKAFIEYIKQSVKQHFGVEE